MKLIVGLGNPGKKYESTRHNAGWIALDALIEKYGYEKVKFDEDIHLFITEVENEKVIFAKPQTFMNNSGIPIKRIVNFFKINIDDLIIIHDEKDFEVNKNQFKFGGSSAGHNGIKSVIQNLGTQNFWRYRLGVGNPPKNWLIIDWVLSKLSSEEIKNIKSAVIEKSNFISGWVKTNSLKEVVSKL